MSDQHHYSRTVSDARVWQDMDGQSEVEKRLNSLLTTAFILTRDVPADECVTEARELIGRYRQDPANAYADIARFLQSQFGHTSRTVSPGTIETARQALEILKEYGPVAQR